MNEKPRQELAERIRAVRKLRGMSQAELASEAGISVMTLNAIERGGNATLATLDKIGLILDVRLY